MVGVLASCGLYLMLRILCYPDKMDAHTLKKIQTSHNLHLLLFCWWISILRIPLGHLLLCHRECFCTLSGIAVGRDPQLTQKGPHSEADELVNEGDGNWSLNELLYHKWVQITLSVYLQFHMAWSLVIMSIQLLYSGGFSVWASHCGQNPLGNPCVHEC